jgi:HK97 family phage portal protein
LRVLLTEACIVAALGAFLLWEGVIVMKLVRAMASDGRVFRAANGGFHVTGKAANSAYRQMMIFGDGMSAAGGKIQNPYEVSAWVMRAIKIIAQPISALPLEFYADKKKGDTLISGGPAAEFWSDPFMKTSVVDGVEATISWLKLKGNAFWIKDDSWFSGSKQKSKLIIARPDRMTPIKEGGELLGWRYQDSANRSHSLPAPYVEHLKNWNPYDEVWGLAEWEAARMATEADYYAGKYARDLMAGSGDQGDVVVSKGGVLQDDQREQIKAALIARKRAREAGRFLPIFLTGDVAVEKANVTTPDADFVSNRLENRHEIFIAFGVPPSMADVKASYSIGADSDYARLIEQTCMPAAAKFCEAVENISKSLEGRKLFVCFGWEENSTVQASRRERIEAATKFWDRGMSWKTINETLDLGLAPFPGWEKAYVPFSIAEVGAESTAETSTEYAELVVEPSPAETMDKMLMLRSRSKLALPGKTLELPAPAPKKVCECGCGIDTKAAPKWASHMAKRRPSVKTYIAKFNKQLFKARSEVLANIDKAGRTEMAKGWSNPNFRVRTTAADLMFDSDEWEAGLLAEMRKAGSETLKTAGQQLFDEVGKDDPFSMPSAQALKFLSQRDNLMRDVSADVFSRIQGTLQSGLTDGDSMSQLANRVRAEFTEISKGRANTIASTETAAAYGTARDVAMKEAGVQWKEWLTSGNENVRESHRAAEGQTVRLDEPFNIGGASLMFPGDPSGPPEEVINCHCVQIAVAAPTEEGEA